MKKSIIFIITISIVILSCQKNDVYKGAITQNIQKPNFDASTPLGRRLLQQYENYGMIVSYDFTEKAFLWDWSVVKTNTPVGGVGFRFTYSIPEYIPQVLDSLNKWVLDIFPREFIKDKMPINLYLTDTICNIQAPTSIRLFEGDINSNLLALAYVSERFDNVKKSRLFLESWVSLIVEKLVSSGSIPFPTKFAEISADGYSKSAISNSEDVVKNYGILKKSRKKQNAQGATSAWYKTEPAQDFGDFVAYMIYYPQTEKNVIYAKNARVQQKCNLVADYFKSNFNIELPTLPRN